MSWIDGETGLPLESSEKIKKKLISIMQANQELSNRVMILEEEKQRLMSIIEALQNKVDGLSLENVKIKELLERLATTDNVS